MFYDDTKKSGNNEKINNFYHENVFAGFELVAYRMNGSFDKYLRSWAAFNLFYLTSFSIFSPRLPTETQTWSIKVASRQ